MPLLLKFGLDKLLFSQLTEGINRLSTLSQSVSAWRVSQGDKLRSKDLFAALIDAQDPETGKLLEHGELVAEAGLLIIAGSDTTITAITATMFYLLHYPQALARLHHELRGKFSQVEDIRIGETLASCSFINACIDESMRLSPSVGSVLPREVLPGGLKIDDIWIPEGTDVGVPHYTIHHNEAYFSDPFDFKPERWLPNETTFDGKTLEFMHSAFTPFGVGRTSCVGKYLAYQEMSLILARLLWLYDMRLEPHSTTGEGSVWLGHGRQRQNEFQLKDRFVSTHEGPMVQFKRRASLLAV